MRAHSRTCARLGLTLLSVTSFSEGGMLSCAPEHSTGHAWGHPCGVQPYGRRVNGFCLAFCPDSPRHQHRAGSRSVSCWGPGVSSTRASGRSQEGEQLSRTPKLGGDNENMIQPLASCFL